MVSSGDQGSYVNEPWREILQDHFVWESPIELFFVVFLRRQTS